MTLSKKKLQLSLNEDAKTIYEGLNSQEARDLFKCVTDLYEEVNEFENCAPPAAIDALSPHLNHVREMLEMMMQNPMNYVSNLQKEKEESQKVVLKPTKA
ncbi:MAG: hypothetical protein EBU90_11385 [Proteobacteria bacterium]|nr:hypothetical protein [Pseudomonadota bacterium]